jgi:DNA-directed RNA polymerase specialized sigma24 family protein
MHNYLPHQNHSDSKLFLWVSPVDEKNQPADPVFVEAAYRIGGGFLFYRARELNDDGRAIELVERAVHLASRARKSRPVAEPQAYLFRTFTNLVDAEIARYRRIVPLTDELLHEVASRAAPCIEQEIDRETDWKHILESLDQTVRMVYERLRQGLTVREIALEMGVKPNTLVQRIHRARKQMKSALDQERARGRTSKNDGNGRTRRAGA